MKNSLLLLAFLALGLTGCASIVSGTHQPVLISTDPVKGAKCTLENNKGSWYVPSTPGQVMINRSYENLNVECRKKGYPTAHKVIPSATKALIAGNILIGGPIGGAVDVVDGAAYDYPSEIRIPIERA
ncbi:MAG TPA: hypothetical protein VLH77_07110 [Gammaproteobacteria bacterium]|nr:hypothetical protein [Gammaproteobacteria bacterium]